MGAIAKSAALIFAIQATILPPCTPDDVEINRKHC